MTPEAMAKQLASVRVEDGQVVARLSESSPQAVAALRHVKLAILLLHQGAQQARCAEPLHVLVHEFRYDLEQMAAGAWPVETVVEAIRVIGPGYSWQFNAEATY